METPDRLSPPVERVAEAPEYGPGGHPQGAHRDYSAAWEKPTLADEADQAERS